MRTPNYDMSIFEDRRKAIAKHFKNSALIIPANPEYIRSNDSHFPFRQDTNLFYLTGFEEPESVLLFRPGQTPETTLFVMPKNVEMETWTGFRYGPEGAKKSFRVDAAFSNEELDSRLKEMLKDVDKVYCSMFINREFDQRLLKIVEAIALARSRTNKGNLTIEDPRAILGEARLRKSEFEAATMRKSCEITSRAHVEVMKHTRPGVNERALHGVFMRSIMEQGCAREAYTGIFATGANATTLHYVFNDQNLKDGDMLLVDAGGEYNFYAADITRTYPANGKFSAAQKRVYQAMLELQKHLVTAVKPGVTRADLQKMSAEGVTDILINEKLLKGSRAEILEKKDYFKFYPHGVGHWLGSDVHDAGLTELNGEPRPLEAGFVLTIEPGVYIPYDTPGCLDELRGLGIRIEDDVLVTASGHENLTASCPKEISEMEALIGKA